MVLFLVSITSGCDILIFNRICLACNKHSSLIKIDLIIPLMELISGPKVCCSEPAIALLDFLPHYTDDGYSRSGDSRLVPAP